MEGVPRALLMPASRASAATRSKPTIAGQADGGVVQRLLQGVARRYLAVILAFKVVRRVLVLRAHVVGGLLVAEHGQRREQLGLAGQHGAFDGGVEGRGIDKRLEDGAGGPLGHRMVQLRVAVAAPAHQRQHLAGVGIERHQRHLRIDVCSGRVSCRCACSLSTCSSTT